jgi:hypothetical protein
MSRAQYSRLLVRSNVMSRWNAFVRGAWRQLPIETAIVALAAIGAIGLVHRPREVWFLRLLLAGVIATPLAVAAHRLERRGPRLPLIAGGVAAAGVLVAVSAGASTVDALDSGGFCWPYLLSVLAAMLVPFVVPGPPFAGFVRRFFEQTTTWAILCGCALAAVGVVTLALAELFDLRIRLLALDASIVLGCGFILVYLHRLLDGDPGSRGRMPELWRRLATMIGAPFVTAMLAILAVYEIVARTRGELPRNMLSPLIMAAGLVGFVSTLIISSVLDEDRGTSVLAPADPHRWARRWSVRLTRAFPAPVLALLPMAGWALWLRIDQHGITPFRAVRGIGLLCLATLSLLGTMRWARGRPALSWQVPAAIIGFALVAAFGPLSAVQLSIRSQAARVARFLDEAGAGRTVAETAGPARIELAPERYRELDEALRSLASVGGVPALQRVLTGSVGVCSQRWMTGECLARLGIAERGSPVSPPRDPVTVLETHDRVLTAAGEVELIDLTRQPNAADLPASHGQPGSGFRLEADRVVFQPGSIVVAEASLAALIRQREINHGLPASALPLVRADGTIVGELAVERLDVWQADSRAAQVTRLTAIAIWRRSH